MVAPVVRCQACWRDAAKVSYCVGCGLTLCHICRGDDPVLCAACTQSSIRGRRGVVALARRSTALLLDDAAREAEGSARRVAAGRDGNGCRPPRNTASSSPMPWRATSCSSRQRVMRRTAPARLRSSGSRRGAGAAPPRSPPHPNASMPRVTRRAAHRRVGGAARPAARRPRSRPAAQADRRARAARPRHRRAAGHSAPDAEPLSRPPLRLSGSWSPGRWGCRAPRRPAARVRPAARRRPRSRAPRALRHAGRAARPRGAEALAQPWGRWR